VQYLLTNLRCATKDLLDAKKDLITGASGWRKVFAPSKNEQDKSPSLTVEDSFLVALIALAYYKTLKPKKVVVGSDTRPTSNLILEVVTNVFLAKGVEVIYLGVSAAPEIMAFSKNSYFLYVTASHNPIGHNGFKFGFNQQVVEKEVSSKIEETFLKLLEDQSICERLKTLSDKEKYEKTILQREVNKQKALKVYKDLIIEVATTNQRALPKVKDKSLKIVCDMNGSARSTSIDQEFLNSLHIETHFFNTDEIVHEIVPEGENLRWCKETLATLHQQDNSYQLGYTVDNDGDRGNIVYWDEKSKSVQILEAQKLFALIATIELASIKENKAIAVNGPTSLMIDELSKRWNFKVSRSEVGEANVVTLAKNLREQGYIVPLLGEGSNGGTIAHPSKVRDPLNTLVSLIRVLTDCSLFEKITSSKGKPTISKLLEALPQRVVTPTSSPLAILKINQTNHQILKRNYEDKFLESWESKKEFLKQQYGIYSYIVEQTEGPSCKVGLGEDFRSGKMRGGLKVLFLNKENQPTDFIWMRGSATEPVFRILADTKGLDENRHAYFLKWQTELVVSSDY